MITITVIGGDLFKIAAQQLGDPLQWTRIAAANGYSDPRLPNQSITLMIPNKEQPATETGVLGWSGPVL